MAVNDYSCETCGHHRLEHRIDFCHRCIEQCATHLFKAKSAVPDFPEAVGRVVSVVCPCKWEATYIFPEESNLFLLRVLEHIRDKHDIAIPPMKLVHH